MRAAEVRPADEDAASRPLDLRLYLVTDPVLGGGRPLVELVAAAVRGGVTAVQLRDKSASDDALLRQALAIREVLAPVGVPLVVNDRVDVALAADADGVHVGTGDASPTRARERLGRDAIVGWSLENLEQVRDPALTACSYLAASPVWSTPTKTDTARALGLAGVARLRALTTLPLVAIGGIDASRVGEVVRAGADGVAVVSAVMAAYDPEAAARQLREAVDAALDTRRTDGQVDRHRAAIRRAHAGADGA